LGYVRQDSRRRVSRDGRRGLSGRATGLLPEAGFYESGRRLAGAVVGLVDLRTPRDLHGPADELPDVVMLRLTGQGDVVAWCIEESGLDENFCAAEHTKNKRKSTHDKHTKRRSGDRSNKSKIKPNPNKIRPQDLPPKPDPN